MPVAGQPALHKLYAAREVIDDCLNVRGMPPLRRELAIPAAHDDPVRTTVTRSGCRGRCCYFAGREVQVPTEVGHRDLQAKLALQVLSEAMDEVKWSAVRLIDQRVSTLDHAVWRS